MTVVQTLLLSDGAIDNSVGENSKIRPILHEMVGDALYDLDEKEASIPHYEKAHTGYTKNLGSSHEDTLAIGIQLANVYREKSPQKSLELQTKILNALLAKHGENHERTVEIRWNLANTLESLGRNEEAAKIRTELLSMGQNGSNAVRTILLISQLSQEITPRTVDELKQNTSDLETLIEQARKLPSVPFKNICQAQLRLSRYYSILGLQEEATSKLESLLDWSRQFFGVDHTNTLDVMQVLSLHYADNGEYAMAISLGGEFVPRLVRRYGESDFNANSAMMNLGGFYLQTGEYANAEKWYHSALESWIKENPFTDQHSIRLQDNLSIVLCYQNKIEEARVIKENLVQMCRVILPRLDESSSQCINNLGLFHFKCEELEKAEMYFKEAYELRKEAHGDSWHTTLLSLSGVANCAFQQKRYEEASNLAYECLSKIGTKNILPRFCPEMIEILFGSEPYTDDREFLKEGLVFFDERCRGNSNALFQSARYHIRLVNILKARGEQASEIEAELKKSCDQVVNLIKSVEDKEEILKAIRESAEFDAIRHLPEISTLLTQ